MTAAPSHSAERSAELRPKGTSLARSRSRQALSSAAMLRSASATATTCTLQPLSVPVLPLLLVDQTLDLRRQVRPVVLLRLRLKEEAHARSHQRGHTHRDRLDAVGHCSGQRWSGGAVQSSGRARVRALAHRGARSSAVGSSLAVLTLASVVLFCWAVEFGCCASGAAFSCSASYLLTFISPNATLLSSPRTYSALVHDQTAHTQLSAATYSTSTPRHSLHTATAQHSHRPSQYALCSTNDDTHDRQRSQLSSNTHSTPSSHSRSGAVPLTTTTRQQRSYRRTLHTANQTRHSSFSQRQSTTPQCHACDVLPSAALPAHASGLKGRAVGWAHGHYKISLVSQLSLADQSPHPPLLPLSSHPLMAASQ